MRYSICIDSGMRIIISPLELNMIIKYNRQFEEGWGIQWPKYCDGNKWNEDTSLQWQLVALIHDSTATENM